MAAARRLLLPLAVLVAALVAVHPVAGGTGGESGEPAVRGGSPLLDVSGLVPGRAVEGSVTIANAGTASGTFVLAAAASGDRLLGERLHVVFRLGGGVLYEGPLAGFAGARLGVLAPGQERELEVRAELPRSAGNELQGVSASVELAVTAVG